MAKSASKQTKPKIGYFIQSRGPGGMVEFEEVYVYGPTHRSDEGIVGHDLRMRPMRLGPGDYTFVGSPDDVEWTRPASAPIKKSHAQIKREIDEVLAKKSGSAGKPKPSTEGRMHEAQLYWDDQDSKNEGWWLRFRDDRGTEQGTAIDGDEDASTQELANAIEKEAHWLPANGKIKVFRGEQPRGSITLKNGEVSDWRAG